MKNLVLLLILITALKVASIPHKTFTGYHLLAYYYVSFALAVPERLEMLDWPYKNEYEMAITIRKPPK